MIRRYVRTLYPGFGVYRCIEHEDGEPYDKRQWDVGASELPEEIRLAAEALRGSFPAYVEWPVSAQEQKL